MNYLITLLIGVFTSIMIMANGGLASEVGVYLSTVMIHLIGLIFVTLILFIRKENPFGSKLPWYLYLGGALGVSVTAFNSLAVGQISISAILALTLLGQSVSSIVIDQFGFMGMDRYPFKKRKILGLALIYYGVTFMIDDFEFIPVLLVFLAGVNLAVSRTINGKLAEKLTVMMSTFFNFFIGFLVAIPVTVILELGEASISQVLTSFNFFIYSGGILGVIIVLLTNIVVSKISAFYITLLLFVGQVFTGLLLDRIILGEFLKHDLVGVLFVAFGLIVNLILDKTQKLGYEMNTSDSHS